MKLDTLVLWTALSAGAVTASAAHAQSMPEFSFSGYGTLGGAISDNDEGQFVSSSRQHHGADTTPDLGVDSRLGLQGNVKFNEMFSAVGQVLTKRQDGGTRPRVEWLYVDFKPASWLSFKAGRMVLPVYLLSDSRNVGYAAHWLREPTEVYATMSASSFDGVQGQVRGSLGGTNLSLQLSGGKAKAKSYPQIQLDLDMKKIQSVNLVAENGDWTVRLGRTQYNIELTSPGAFFPVVKDRFSTAGVQYDDGQWLVMSEFAQRRSVGGGGDSNSYYVSTGWRFGSVMPYVTYARFKAKGSNFPVKGETGSEAVGVRWDAYKNIAVKGQLESTNSGIAFVNTTVPFIFSQPKVTLLSLAVDFVF